MSEPFLVGFGRKKEPGKTIYANALLSDGKLLFWYTGEKCSEESFYKDFYYSGINQAEYFNNHKMTMQNIAFEISEDDTELNNFVFEHLAPMFYSRFEMHEDSKGKNPY